MAQRFRPPATIAREKQAAAENTQVLDATKAKALSLNVIRTLLDVSISAIAYLRNLLPEENFEQKTFSAILQGNALLDLLTNGVMDSLEKGYLKSLVVFIFLDHNDPDNIIESYTYDFFYVPGSLLPSIAITTNSAVHDVSMQSVSSITVGEIKKSLKEFTKRLVHTLKGLDELPEQRYLDIKLLYNDTAPPE
ncbi:hypothetical protein Q5752_006411 [Cryptotrichosporon argae]